MSYLHHSLPHFLTPAHPQTIDLMIALTERFELISEAITCYASWSVIARHNIRCGSSNAMNHLPYAIHVLDNFEGGETKGKNEDDSEDEENNHEPLSLLCESHVARSFMYS